MTATITTSLASEDGVTLIDMPVKYLLKKGRLRGELEQKSPKEDESKSPDRNDPIKQLEG